MPALARIARSLARAVAGRPSDDDATAGGGGRRRRREGRDRRDGRDGRDHRGGAPEAYPGDFTGAVHPVYAPDLDGAPDPGEIVWTWVPFEEDPSKGKDRPVLLLGRDGRWLLALMLSTRDHDDRPGRPGEEWLDLGSGAWDAQGRASEVRLDRVLRVRPEAVRREGAVLDRERFEQVARSLAGRPGW